MTLWILRPIGYESLADVTSRGDPQLDKLPEPWSDFYDKTFGLVVRAETEQRARELAAEGEHAGWEMDREWERQAWLDPNNSTCVELNGAGDEGVIIQDYWAA